MTTSTTTSNDAVKARRERLSIPRGSWSPPVGTRRSAVSTQSACPTGSHRPDPGRARDREPARYGDRGALVEHLVVDPLDLVDDAAVQDPCRLDARAAARREQIDARAAGLLEVPHAGDLE